MKGTRKVGGKGKRKKEGIESLRRPSSHQFPPVLFSCSRFLNSCSKPDYLVDCSQSPIFSWDRRDVAHFMYRGRRATGIIALGGWGEKNRGEANMLSTSIRKMFHQWMFAEFFCCCCGFFGGGMAQKLCKITALKGDICKQAISMLNVSGIFFIAFSSRWSYGKIEDCELSRSPEQVSLFQAPEIVRWI